MYLFYTATSGTIGRVEAIYQNHEVSEADKAHGFSYEGALPVMPEEASVLYLDTASGALWYETEGVSQVDDVADLRERLTKAENRLLNPDEQFKALIQSDKTLDEIKAAKVSQLKHLSEQEIAGGFVSTVTGYTFGFNSTDQDNMTKQMLLFLANPDAVSCSWKTLNAGVVQLPKADFFAVAQEGEVHTRTVIGRQWELSQMVNAAETKTAVSAIVW